MFHTLKAKGNTWVVNQEAPFLSDSVMGIVTDIYEDQQFVGIEVSLNNGGEIFIMKVPIVNKDIDEYETIPSRKQLKEEKENYEKEVRKRLGKDF